MTIQGPDPSLAAQTPTPVPQVQAPVSTITGGFVQADHRLYKNIAGDALMVTRDKVELALYHHRDRMKARDSWVAPFGTFSAALAALLTSDFKRVLGLSADAWQAVFVITMLLSLFWLVKTVFQFIRIGRNDPTEAIIEELRSGAP
jgi:hypothetical protein